jgi:cobalt-zinc-cadmium efflux system membrane fusion protein
MKSIQHTSFLIALMLASIFILSACKSSTSTEIKKEDSTTISKEEPEEHEGLALTQQQMNAVGITISNIEQKNLNAVVKASGQLAVPPQNMADVNVLMGGIIKKIFVLEGQHIKKGAALVVIENPELIQLQQDYLTTINHFSYTQDELQRQKDLNDANAGVGKNLQQAQSTYNAEKSKIATLAKQLQQLGINPTSVANGNILSQITITAPISGTIGHIAVNTGTYAETSKPLMEIVDNSQIHCDLIVYEKDLFKVHVGQKVNFMLTNQNNAEIEGRIYGINKSFEDESKGIIVHAIIENASKYNLIQGMYVTALIDVGSQLTPAAPVDAIVRSANKDYIYAVDEAKSDSAETHFKQTEVVTGVTELGYTQITLLDSLAANAKIVTKGAFYILSKTQAGSEEQE